MEDRLEFINEIREFNRFYTVFSGFLNRSYLESGYSVTETRILFELRQNQEMSANQITKLLRLDKSYVSRLIRRLEEHGIVTRAVDAKDRRAMVLRLTPKGRTEAEGLIARTNQEISGLVESLGPEACGSLCASMRRIREILSDSVGGS